MRHFIDWGCLAVPPLNPSNKKLVAKAVSAKQRSIFIGKPPPRICRYSRVNCLGLPPPPPCVQNFSNSLFILLHSCCNQFIPQPTQSMSRRTCHGMVVYENVSSWPLLVVFESVQQNFARLSSFICLRTFAPSTAFICAKIIMLYAKIRAARLNKTKKAKVDLIKVEWKMSFCRAL